YADPGDADPGAEPVLRLVGQVLDLDPQLLRAALGSGELLRFVGVGDRGGGPPFVGDQADLRGRRLAGDLLEGDGDRADLARLVELDLQPLPDGAGEAAGPPGGAGGVVERGVGGAARVADARRGAGAGLAGGGGDRGDAVVHRDRG